MNCVVEDCGGNAVNLSFDHFNMPIFCASIGGYSLDRHLRLIKGSEAYPGNPDYRAFVVLDAAMFGNAMASALRLPRDRPILERDVIYMEREELVSLQEMEQRMDKVSRERFYRKLPFMKPPRFSLEEEVRFTAPFCPGDTAILTSELPRRMQRALKRAIVDEGSAEPR